MSKISSEYAKALFMLAIENDCLESYDEALDLVSEVFINNPDYSKVLASYSIPLSERLDAIDKAFSGELPKEVLSFLKLLCEKRHISEFSECAKQYKDMVCDIQKLSNAKVTSAAELSENEKTALKEKLEKIGGHSVNIDYAVDKSILGGLIVEIDGKIMDSSLKKHLKNVKDVIIK